MFKLGFYLQDSSDLEGQLFNAVRRVRPPVMLVHTDSLNEDLLQINRSEAGPNAFVIGRHFRSNQQQEEMLDQGDPAENGRAYAGEIVTRNFGQATRRGQNGRLLIDAWMSLNEAVPGPASASFQSDRALLEQRLRAYDKFQVAFHRRLQEAGIEAVAFNFAAGNFIEPDHYIDYFDETLRTYTYLGFHEYGWHHLNPEHEDTRGRAKSGAGIYRRCMEGIRAQYGPRHVVIMTEAGLTREYKFAHEPRDPGDEHLGDLGWLCFSEQPSLTEQEYFDSLAWYNDLIAQDDYVLGCCLYEVGHSRRFEAHRHIGKDNQGNALTLMARLAALHDAVTEAGDPLQNAAASAAAVTMAVQRAAGTLRLHGYVRDGDGMPLTNVAVRLIGTVEQLGSHAQAVVALSHDLAWTRVQSGIEGSRWRCYQQHVQPSCAGISYAEFKERVVVENPHLAGSDYRFQPDETYRLPDLPGDTAALEWRRLLVGYQGDRRQCWSRFVAGKVPGLDWPTFAEAMIEHNPHLAAGLLTSDQQYRLPLHPDYAEYELFTNTTSTGRYEFENLAPGLYRLLVSAPGQPVYCAGLSMVADRSHDITVGAPSSLAAAAVALDAGPFVRSQGDRFFLGGQPLPRFIGVNLPSLLHFGDTRILNVTGISREAYLDMAHEIGARVVRAFVPHHLLSNDEIVARLQTTLHLLQQRGMYLIPVLVDLYNNSGFYPTIARQFSLDFKENSDEKVRLGPEFFTGGFEHPDYQTYVRTVVQSVSENPNLFCWEIGNELKMERPGDNPPGSKHGDPDQFVKFCTTMARQIKEWDQNRHLVTTGMISTQHAWMKHRPDLVEKLCASPHIDFLTVHVYYPASGDAPNNDPDDDAAHAHTFDKPIIVEEAGIHRAKDDFRGRLEADLRRWFDDSTVPGQTARPRQRAAGYMIWRFDPLHQGVGSGELHDDLDVLKAVLGARTRDFSQESLSLDTAAPAAIEMEPESEGTSPMTTNQNKIGIDANQPVIGRHMATTVANPRIIADSGAGWVRLNFVLEDAASPRDPQWQETYRTIISRYQENGMSVYGLIGGQAVKTGLDKKLLNSIHETTGAARAEADAWIAEYVENFYRIVEHFHEQVTYFESFNEPNNWAIPGVQANVVHETWFAHMLHRIFHRVKPDFHFVKLISGPLLGHYHHQTAGTVAPAYLRGVYREGRQNLGWGGNFFPFDGVGYHLYLKPNQNSDFAGGQEHPEPMDWPTHAKRVRTHYETFMQAMMAVIREFEGPNTLKRIFITEIGWTSNDASDEQRRFQAESVRLALELIADDPRVELGFWFCTVDFLGHPYGLYHNQGDIAQARKPAFAAFQDFCRQRFGDATPVGFAEPAMMAAAPVAMPTRIVHEDLDRFGVAVRRANVAPGTRYWRLIEARHADPNTEFGGTEHVYIEAFDEQGQKMRNTVKVEIRESGRVNALVLDKNTAEPGANEAMNAGDRVDVMMLGNPSDSAGSFHTSHGPYKGGDLHHHAWYVAFQLTVAGGGTVAETTDDQVRNVLWQQVGSGDAGDAFALFARSQNLGMPATARTTVGNLTAQGFACGIVVSADGDSFRVIPW